MAHKFNTLKCIKKGLIDPNILFPAAYLLFSAEVCTSSPKNKPSSHSTHTVSSSLKTEPLMLDSATEDLALLKTNAAALAAANPVDDPDKVGGVEALENDRDPVDDPDKVAEESEGDGAVLAAANPVDATDKVLEESEGNAAAVAASNPVDDLDKVEKAVSALGSDRDLVAQPGIGESLTPSGDGSDVLKGVHSGGKPQAATAFVTVPLAASASERQKGEKNNLRYKVNCFANLTRKGVRNTFNLIKQKVLKSPESNSPVDARS